MTDKMISRKSINTVEVFVDGGCPSNGSADAQGFYSFAVKVNGEVVRLVHKQPLVDEIGDSTKQTNNVAEYVALLSALRYIAADQRRAGLSYTLYTDSKLVHDQITGKANVKDMVLIGLNATALDLLHSLKVFIERVPRKQIVSVLGH